MYAVPEEFFAERGVTEEVCKAVINKFGGGDVVGVTGVEGNSTDLIRSRGRDDAIKAYPKIKLAGELPGKWNREDSQKAMEALIARHPKIVGVIAQNDDVADGCMAALRAAGMRPGSDVFRVAPTEPRMVPKRSSKGTLLATSANVPAYMALLAAGLYDVMHGWKPRRQSA
jgi:ABC-type sugar transport system substrate-binding protein